MIITRDKKVVNKKTEVFDKCSVLSENIIIEAKLFYPLIKRSIHTESLINYVWMDKKMLWNYHFQKSSQKKYEKLYKLLKLVDIDKYVNFLIKKK